MLQAIWLEEIDTSQVTQLTVQHVIHTHTHTHTCACESARTHTHTHCTNPAPCFFYTVYVHVSCCADTAHVVFVFCFAYDWFFPSFLSGLEPIRDQFAQSTRTLEIQTDQWPFVRHGYAIVLRACIILHVVYLHHTTTIIIIMIIIMTIIIIIIIMFIIRRALQYPWSQSELLVNITTHRIQHTT